MDGYLDLGGYTRAITTTSPEAQTWFDRGLNWCWGYWHEEAVACFKQALEHDPDCAMAHWGIAYALGPNYNMPWHLYDPAGKAAALGAAYDAMGAALARADGVSQAERALIQALRARYPQRDPVDEMDPWNAGFADAMRAVHKQWPDDMDIRAVFVEAIMNVTPWKMWDLKTGHPVGGVLKTRAAEPGFAEAAAAWVPGERTEAPEGTLEALAVLDEAFADQPAAWDHPGLLHLHVHLMEMSPYPQKALPTGDRLRTLAPDMGHLIHMPTHIDVLCGNYHDVVHWNLKAIEADNKAVARAGAMNFYTLYRVHNFHFAIYGAMFLGQYKSALDASEALIATVPEDFLRVESPPIGDFLEAYLGHKQHVLVRFGKWQEIVDQPLPEDQALYAATTTMMHYAKTVAHAAMGQIAGAEAERELFRAARARTPEGRRVHNNLCSDLFDIAEEMASGEIEYRRGNFDLAFAHLRKSVELDDNLPYDEPWGWMQPTRHALGALLLEQGQTEEAEAVYRADLGLDPTLSRACQHPDNPWALHGLYECLTRRGETAEAVLIKQRLDLASARADVPIKASCLCRIDKAA